MIRILMVFLVVVSLIGCKKDKEVTPSVVGFWEGKYGNGTNVPQSPYFFLFRPDGTVKVYADNADTSLAGKAEGTYIVTGNKVKTTYSYSPSNSYSSIADVDVAFKTMDGTYGVDANTSGGGTFRIFKK